MNVANLLLRASRIAPRSPAVRIGARTVLDYASLGSRAASIAADLAGPYRLSKGDRVILLMTNCAEYVECLFGCWQAGAVCVPVNAKLHEREIAFIIENCGAKVGFVTRDLAGTFARALAIAGEADFAGLEIGSTEF